MNMTVQITLALVFAVIAFGTILALIVNEKQNKRNQALNVITGGQHHKKKAESSDKRLARKRDEIAKKLKEAGDMKSKKKKDKPGVKQLMEQAGFEAPVSRFWVFSALFGTVFWLLVSSTGFPVLAKIFLGFSGFLGVPRFFLKWRAGRRQRKFLEEFSDALEGMVRLLQAGMPVTEAIAMVGREYEGPVGDEMRYMYDDQKIGISLGEAGERCAKRMPLTEVQMFATALQIQSETGSSLSEVLLNLAAVIRSRFRLKRKVKALSSEAKASAAIIGALPILVAGGLYAVNPDYISLLFTEPTGKILVTCALFWMGCGILIMRQMINFKV